ncbi:ubiquinone anaerobic biosynthesis accessory factor UbiT [Modicisalibacter xianhensis]|uniref:Ubiquinone biosynthesis accessory factor UbiT n=1 Tax=Modicisalibacter xianhensis TaxID=442341 RepID=A0A1I3DKV5_9GAMM|nr:SCP2 sterol-binding domain-containing protein [Halomonas xianhensis]SFH87357.1 SCP-2 sterol transfer family protein [Halomonas xianhensis]
MPWPFSTPLPVVKKLDAKVPLTLKRRLVEPPLNRAYAKPLRAGEFDELEGRRVGLAIDDLGIALVLSVERSRLVLVDATPEVVIRGGWREFLCLATRREDPDGLFFQRRLAIEGDTELGLTVKNLLDGLEEGIAQGRLGDWLSRLERLANR